MCARAPSYIVAISFHFKVLTYPFISILEIIADVNNDAVVQGNNIVPIARSGKYNTAQTALNDDSNTCPNKHAYENPWWGVDLGAVFKIHYVTILKGNDGLYTIIMSSYYIFYHNPPFRIFQNPSLLASDFYL